MVGRKFGGGPVKGVDEDEDDSGTEGSFGK